MCLQYQGGGGFGLESYWLRFLSSGRVSALLMFFLLKYVLMLDDGEMDCGKIWLTYSVFVSDQEAVLAVVWERNMASQGEFSDH